MFFIFQNQDKFIKYFYNKTRSIIFYENQKCVTAKTQHQQNFLAEQIPKRDFSLN